MKILNIVKKGQYFDSITIMLIAKKLSEVAGVTDSAVVMGTKENIATLRSAGLLSIQASTIGEMDLIAAFTLADESNANQVTETIESIFTTTKQSKTSETLNPQSLESAMAALPDANLAMISVAGKYAGDVAMDALQHGLHVMLFSDNVSVEKEIELKTYAGEQKLFVMGPDCGTAIINGVPLAFANVVSRGTIGIVAASGTGLQEVSCLISNAGGGISQAIGTGGRDVKKDVGGIMFLQGMRTLANDPNTNVILLVSKPPAPEVVEKIITCAQGITKPIVGVFLGANPTAFVKSSLNIGKTLEEAAALAVAFAKKQRPDECLESLLRRDHDLSIKATQEAKQFRPAQRYLRALYSGGTFCDEAQLIAHETLPEVYSNIPFGRSKQLSSSWKSEKHTIIDLGDDEFTVGKPHPMIDYSTRNKRIMAEMDDPETAVLLLDIVLGYGSNPDPLSELTPVFREIAVKHSPLTRFVPVICSVTGTDNDPQNRSAVVAGLRALGLRVMESNAAACKAALYLVSKLGVNHE